MAAKDKGIKTVSENGMSITTTWEDGSSVTGPNPDYNPEPNFGPPTKAKAPGKNAGKPALRKTATPTPTPTPKQGTQKGHAVTNSKNNTRTVK
jgi:hypothetical protein